MINQYTDEFLRVLRKSNKEIAHKMDKIDELRAKIEGVGAICYDERVQSSGEMDRMASTIAKIVDLEQEVEEMCKDYNVNRAWVEYIINKIDSETQKKVLVSLYVDGNTVLDTARMLRITESGVKKARKRALKSLEDKIMNENSEKPLNE